MKKWLCLPFVLLGAMVSSAQTPSPLCAAPPSQITNTPEETAWRLFIYAMCPTGKSAVDARLAWETWADQKCYYNPQAQGCQTPAGSVSRAPSQRFQRSRLEQARSIHRTALGLAPLTAATPDFEGCIVSATTGRTVCEEAHLDPNFTKYATANKLTNRTAQAAFAAKPGIDFPTTAVEVKTDWIQYPGKCAAQGSNLAGVYAEDLSEKGSAFCYAMVGIHISSKATKNWVWATFEPQNVYSNPERCFALGCNDSFGATPAATPKWNPNFKTNPTQPLLSLMSQAKLDAVLRNYRLDGVQIDFGTKANPSLLGNSVIEGENAGVPMTQSSCIACHFNSIIENKPGDPCNGTDGIRLLNGNPIGPQPPPPANFYPRDFVWSMLLTQPPSPKNCPPPAKK